MDLINFLIFSSWPHVSVNKNDSEIQIFAKYFDIIDKDEVRNQMIGMSSDEEVKSTNAAKIYRTRGNKSYKDQDYPEALKMYNSSISRAPRNSNEFGLAVANRSAVLFDMEKYEECLEDIKTVLRSEYPKDLQYKIFLRQSKCFLKLNMNFEAAKSIRRAEECADKLKLGLLQMSSIKDTIKEMKSKLKEHFEAGASVNEPDDLVLIEPALKDGENPKFLNAAKVVDFKYTKKFGRHVVANTEINKGDVLFIEEPYSFVAEDQPDHHFNFCTFCLQSTLNCIPCTVCTLYFYCSDNCRQNAWELGHRWECLGTRRKIIINRAYKACLSILFKASHDGFKTTIEDESVYGNKVNNYPFVNKLINHKNKYPDDEVGAIAQTAVWMVLYLKNFTDYFDWLYVHPNRPEGSLDELYKFVGGQLLKYFFQTKINATGIREASVNFYPANHAELRETKIGFGIYVSTALLNHSCKPNAVESFNGTTIIIKAIEDIKKGTQITISYLNKCHYISDTEIRQLQLKRYMFTCSCRACTDTNSDVFVKPLLCARCSGKAFPLENNPIMGKCSECHLLFNLLGYHINVERIRELLGIFHTFGNPEHLDMVYKLIKKTYHKHNIAYYAYYTCCLEYYDKTGQFKKCVDIAKSRKEITENIFGDTTNPYICAVLDYCYMLAKYSIVLKNNRSKNYKKFVDQTKALINESANSLQYHMSNKNIKKYVTKITNYLNSDKIEMVTDDLILEEIVI